MTTPYVELMKHTDDQVRILLDPEDALKLVRRLRGVTFFLRLQGYLYTEGDRYYDLGGNVKTSAAQVCTHLQDLVQFNKVKSRAAKPTGRVAVTRLGKCLFVG